MDKIALCSTEKRTALSLCAIFASRKFTLIFHTCIYQIQKKEDRAAFVYMHEMSILLF